MHTAAPRSTYRQSETVRLTAGCRLGLTIELQQVKTDLHIVLCAQLPASIARQYSMRSIRYFTDRHTELIGFIGCSNGQLATTHLFTVPFVQNYVTLAPIQ